MRKRLILLALVCLALAFGLFTPAYAENGYTVEFTRDGLEYVLPGDTSVAMSEILSALGLTGEVDTVEVSNPGLFSASNATGEWVVTAHQAFSTTEWMKVVLNGVSYEIAVTDAELVSVTYIQRGWDESSYTVTESTETASSATPITSTSTAWGTDGTPTTWYVVNSDVTISSRVIVKGTVNLILCDGCTLTAKQGITVNNGNTLNIYGQSGDTGNLIAPNNYDSSGAGIGGGSGSDCGTVNIYGGRVTAYGGYYNKKSGAGIGGGSYGAGGAITIYGGEVNAFANNDYGGAGIGGGGTDDKINNAGSSLDRGGNSGIITIYGGKVTAQSRDGGAGIGGGRFALEAKVYIYGGNINAKCVGGSGAGIGTGQTYNQSNSEISNCEIVIKGNANVTANGNGGGAGIGSGCGYNYVGGAYDITIGGSATISATGSGSGYQGGAGIGGGSLSQGGKITISGGNVTATGANGGTGIGSGLNGIKSTTITISGGTVTAKGSQYGTNSIYSASIGLGAYSDTNSRNGTINLYGGYITAEEYGIGLGNSVGNNNYPVQININLTKDTDAIINKYKYYGNVNINCSLLDAENYVPVNSVPDRPSTLILDKGPRYRITNYTDNHGNTVTAWKDGFPYNNPLEGDKIDIIVTTVAGYRLRENSLKWKDADSDPVSIENLSFTMPAKNVTLDARFDQIPITYIDPTGNTVSNTTNYTPISSELKTWTGSNTPVVAVLGNVTINTRVTVSNQVTLVLTDGATLTIPKGIEVKNGVTLNICAYSTDADKMGSLTINNVDTNNAGIGGSSGAGGKINIHGGKIYANGGYNGAGIGGGSSGAGGTITVNGGIVTATGGSNGAGIGGGNNGAGGTITISGGNIEATGGSNAMGIGGGNGKTNSSMTLTVGFSSADDSLKASSYTALTVNANKILKDGNGAFYTGKLSTAELTAVQNNTLVKADAYFISVLTATGGSVTSSVKVAELNNKVILDVTPADGYELQTLTYQVEGSSDSVNIVKDNDGKYSFEMPQGNVTVTATFALHVHHFTYSANGATITAACTDGCDITTGLTLTISTPTDLTYNGQNKAATLNTGYNTTAFPGTNETNIVYTKGGEAFVGTPTDAGEYAASVTVGEGNGAATARVEYVIAKAEGGISYAEGSLTKTFGDAAFINALTRTGDGTVSYGTNKTDVATVNSETGEVTIVGAGEATITATVTDGDNYTYATKTASYTITVNPATMTVSAEGYTGIYDGQPHSITVTVTKPASGATITYGTSEETYDLTTNPAITNVNDSKTVYFKVTAPNYTVYTGSAAVTLSKASQTAPAAPTKASATINSITLTAITNGEYKMDDGNWQTSPTFTGLTMNKSYTFRQRYTADENHNASVGSDETVISTNNHSHEWGYEAQGATITATCGNTDGGHGTPLTATMTIKAPARTVYGGSESAEATITGSIDGVTNPDIVYKKGSETLNAAPVHAGTYTASITLGEGEGAKTASVEYEIARRALTIDIATATDRAYVKDNTAVTISGVTFKDSSEQAVALTLGEEGDYTVTGAMSDANAGGAKTVNVTVTLKNANYSLATNTTTTTVNISKAAAQTIADVTDSQVYTATSVSASAAGKMPADAGTLTYTAGTASATGSVTVSDFAVNADGTVTATLSDTAAGNTVTLPVTISSTNYADSTVNVKITLTAKGDAGVSISGAPTSAKTYGDAAFTLTGSVTNPGTGTGTWTWSTSDPSVFQITPNGATAAVSILKAGSATVSAKYESLTALDTETTALITVNTKQLTIAAKDQSIYVGRTVPTLDGADFYTVTGLVGTDTLTTKPTLAYQKNGSAATPDNSTAGTYDIVPSGAFAGDSYTITYANGTLTISEKPTATVTKAPTGRTLTYTGSAQELVTAGEATGGTMQYALGDANGATEPYTTSIPSKTDVGTYYVWYKVVGDDDHNDTQPECVTTTIKIYKFTVSYDANGGTNAPAAQTKEYGVTLRLSTQKPSRADYVHNYVTTLIPNGGTLEGESTLHSAQTTVYTFQNWNSSPVGANTSYAPGASYTENASVTLYAQWTSVSTRSKVMLPVPLREGYTFKGWNIHADAERGAMGEYEPTGTRTLYATWKLKQSTITFDTDGGTEIAPITQDYGTAIKAPADPKKENYTFAGWDKAIPATMPAEDMTVKAQWTADRHTITFDTDGGTEIAPITQDYGTAIKAPADPTREGYTFAGWDKPIPATMPAEDMTIKASWTVKRYTITFDTDGGTKIAPITQDYGTAIKAPADPKKENYTFAGWNKPIPATMPAEDMTITAQWTADRHTITFDTAGGTEIAPITQDYGTAITAPADPTREGYTFAGWDKPIPATMPAEDMTIKAKWNVKRYTITFDTDGGMEIAPITQDYGTAITAPADPTRTGYTFAGWDKAIPATMPAEDMTIKASWTINRYTITFDTDGGTKIAPITQDYGTAITAPADPTREGYTFAGWDKAIPTTMPAEDMTIKAKWTVKRYTITFDTDGGTEIAPITQDYGTAITAPANPTKPWYSFLGWEPALPETMPAQNLTVKAVFKLAVPRITGADLVLSGTLDFRFYVELPENFDPTGAYMSFDIHSKLARSYTRDFDESVEIDGKKVYTCPVYSIEMAEPVDAVFHYGTDGKATLTVSIRDYLDKLEEQQGKAKIIDAVRNYGHYMQPYLSGVHGFTVGEGEGYDYQSMPAAGDITPLTELDAYKRVWGENGYDDSVLKSMGYYDSFNESIRLNIRLRFKDVPGTVTATVDGRAGDVRKLSSKTYQVEIPDIAANKLGKFWHVIVTADGRIVYDVHISALSYVSSLLALNRDQAGEREALTAFYEYYEAAKAYKGN